MIDWWIMPEAANWDLMVLVGRVLLWLLALISAVTLVFAFLIFRQSRRMASVLPTPITPAVKLIAVAYLVFCFVALGLVVNYLVL